MKDTNMGNIGTANQSNPVTAHGIFNSIINDEYINIIEKLSELNLKHVKCQYGEWDALLTLEEQDKLIDKYIKYDMLNKEFEWYID